MSLGISKTRIVGFICAFLLLILSYVLLFINTQKLAQQALWMDQANKVITNLEYLASEYQSVENTFRGFMALHDERLKERFYISVKRTDSLYVRIRELVSNNEHQLGKLDTIRGLLTTNISTFNNRIDSAAPFASNELLMHYIEEAGITWLNPPAINRQIKQMEYFESALLLQRTQDLKSFNRAILSINLVSLIISLLLAGYSLNTYRKENLARKEADRQSNLYRMEIESRIEELAGANKEIKELKNIEKFAATGRIARTIAHEVRNPLTNINLATDQLKETVPAGEESSMLFKMVQRNAARINQLISNLLNATKFSDLKFQKTSLNMLLDQALEFANDRMNLKNIRVEKNYDDEIGELNLDEEKIRIAFLNIIVNAVEAMEPGKGILKISTEKAGQKCMITFQDNGSGMTEETLSKLFEPFFTSKEKGSGLGLTNTQNIILNHKGTIEVESESGVGTRFIVILDIP